MKRIVAAAALAALVQSAVADTVIFVNAAAVGANDGSSWKDAYADLQDALAAAQSRDQIWVAAGTYRPGPPDAPLDTTFALVSGVALYGGFAGDETELDERDWEKNETILSGQLSNEPGSRVVHVLRGQGLSDDSRLDGFKVERGAAVHDGPGGGGLLLQNSILEIHNCQFRDNFAAVFESVHGGGALFMEDSSLTLIDSHFLGNNAGINLGGAISAVGSVVFASGCSFTENVAQDGGAISASDSEVVLEGSTLADNSATFVGGAVYLQGSNVTLRDCLLSDNPADLGAIVGFWGNTLTIEDSMLIGTTGDIHTTAFSGSVHLYGDENVVKITGSEFHKNAVGFSSGGALLVEGGTVEIDDSVFADNLAVFVGGAISFTGSAAVIRNTRFFGNRADWDGGAISASGSLILINCEISNNNAADFGGGVAHRLGDLTIINSTITDNASQGVALGLFLGPTNATIINSTLANQHVNLFPRGGHVVLQNSIVWSDNPATCEGLCDVGGGPGCFCHEACCSFGECCFDKFLHCGGCEIEFATLEISHSIVNGMPPHDVGDDPLFVSAAEGDFRLQPGSPAIDAGSNAFVPADITTDLDGNPRIVDGTGDGNAVVDIGAYEFQCAFADLNCDGIVNTLDLLILLGAWGSCPEPRDAGTAEGCPADLDGNGVVNVFDLLELLAHWGSA